VKPGNIYRSHSGTTYRVCGRVMDCFHPEWELLIVEASPNLLMAIHGLWTTDVSAGQTALTLDEYTARHMACPLRVEPLWFEHGATLVREAK
jgi:hypothetical protein